MGIFELISVLVKRIITSSLVVLVVVVVVVWYCFVCLGLVLFGECVYGFVGWF